MLTKLRAIAVDDSKIILLLLEQMCKESPIIELVQTFTDPTEFLSKAPMLEFDLCILDIHMPQMEGTTLAQVLKKPVIFMTASDECFRDAINLSPIDIVPKPIIQDRLYKAFEKAYESLSEKRMDRLFNVAESRKKVKLHLADIMFVTTDDSDPRHKQVCMRNGDRFTLMNYKIEDITGKCPVLIQVNRSEAVSLESVYEVANDLITLKGILADNGKPKQVTLGLSFKEKFKERIFYK